MNEPSASQAEPAQRTIAEFNAGAMPASAMPSGSPCSRNALLLKGRGMKSVFCWAVAGLMAVAISGCVGVAPNKLRPVADGKTIELAKPARWKYDSGWGFGYWEYQLVAGSYKATFEDDGGTYYAGPKPSCLFQTVIIDQKPPAGSSFECLIFVPRKASEPPIVLIVNGAYYPQTAFNPDKTPITDRTGTAGQAGETGDVSAAAANIAVTAVPNASPMQAGLGAGIGAGIVAAMAEAERGRFVEFRKQPPVGWLQSATAHEQ
jgi:hypothetical protein